MVDTFVHGLVYQYFVCARHYLNGNMNRDINVKILLDYCKAEKGTKQAKGKPSKTQRYRTDFMAHFAAKLTSHEVPML